MLRVVSVNLFSVEGTLHGQDASPFHDTKDNQTSTFIFVLTTTLDSRLAGLMLAERFCDKYPAELKILSDAHEVAGQHKMSWANSGRVVQ